MSRWKNSGGVNGGKRSRGRWTPKTGGHALAAGQGRLTVFGSKCFFIIIIIIC